MASEHSYSITLSNNRTEKAAVDYLLRQDKTLWVPDAESRRAILDLLGLPRSFARAFDLVRLPVAEWQQGGLTVTDVESITLIELKTTKKALPSLPRGFFFGATENEFELARHLGDKFRFCFVCLNHETPGHVYLTLEELESLIRTRRTQYQINL